MGGNNMDTESGKRVMAQEIFDAMVDGAIEDLKRAGLTAKEVYSIVENHFGQRYAEEFC